MEKTYTLLWEYGMHHEYISVKEQSFFKVINSLSEEFQIEKEKDKKMNDMTFYFITNYYGDKVLIGSEMEYK